MKQDAPPPRSRRLWRILAAGVMLLALLVLVLPNALLAMPAVRERLSAKVSQRVRLEAAFTGASLTPWSGVRVHGFALRPPAAAGALSADPVLEIREIRVRPDWHDCLRGKLMFSEIEVFEPEGTLPLELLVVLMPPVEMIEPAPAVAVVEKPPIEEVVTLVPAPAIAPAPAIHPAPAMIPMPDVIPAPAPRLPDVVVTPAPGPAAIPAPARPVAPPEVPRETAKPAPAPAPGPVVVSPPDERPRWIRVSGGSLGCTLGGKELLHAEGLAMDLPVGGPRAAGEVRWERLSFLGKSSADAARLPVEWSYPQLTCPKTALTLMGLKVEVGGMALRQPGLPLAIEMTAEGESVEQEAGNWKVEARNVRAAGAFGGVLRMPASWQGRAVATVREVVTRMPAGDPLVFDRCQALVQLYEGVLQCPDVRLTGERLSFLGNATVIRGGGAATMRIVAAPDLAAAWQDKWRDLPGRRPAFLPLETPDRLFMDLRWLSYSGGSAVEVGAGGPVVPTGELLRAWGR